MKKRKTISQRLLALTLCLLCLLAALPIAALADDAAEPTTEPTTLVTQAPSESGDADPSDPSDPDEPVESSQPSEPEASSEPSEPEASSEPSEPENSEPQPSETTEPSEPENSEPTETTAPAETEDQTDPVQALYEQLMACQTLDEINAILYPETEEERAEVEALIAQFTDEQNVALVAKMDELGAYETDTLIEYKGKVTVSNTIETNGCLNVTAPTDTDTTKYTFKWEVQDGDSWVEVKREKKTGDLYNISEDGRSINVALDGGAQKTYRASVATIDGEKVTSSTYSSETKVDYYAELRNGSFETPAQSKFENQDVVGGGSVVWKTTASKGYLEILNTSKEGNKSFAWHGVSNAADGVQCAEINADGEGALYQDVLTVPGSTMYWQISHLGRSMDEKKYYVGKNGKLDEACTDTMYVLIMPYSSARDITTQNDVKKVLNNLDRYPGAKVETITYTWKWTSKESSSGSNKPGGHGPGGGSTTKTYTYTMSHLVNGNWVDTYQYTSSSSTSDTDFPYTKLADPWELHEGEYTVPEGQYLTRYFFVSGTTAHGDTTTGNHIDRVWFSTELPPANPGSISLTIQKTIHVDGWADMTEEQKNTFKNSISFTTNLDGHATISGSEMSWTGNVGTYNIQNYSIGSGGSREVTVTETTTDVDGYELTASEKNWTATINDGGTGKAEFVNTYTPSKVTLTIKKEVSGNMLSHNDEFSFTVTGGNVAVADRSFTLKHGETKEITVKKGDTITITEADGTYDTVYKIDNGETQTGREAEITVTGDETITFTNTHNVTIDTGILLDTLPYILILAVVALGAVGMLRKRRSRDED